MTIFWACMVCEASGTTDEAAERHIRDTGHSTRTSIRPPATSIPFTLTDAGWAAARRWRA
jgi:hypothetical protein